MSSVHGAQGRANAPEPGRTARRDGLRVGLLLLALLAPFADKAFHIDDAFFIAVARNIQRQPGRPFDGAVALDDTDQRVFAQAGRAPNTFETLSHPPLVPYVIAAVATAAGGLGERSQHAAFFLFALLAAGSHYSLARRFGDAPLWPTLALVASPIFVLSAHGLMTDLPALALSLAALALLVAGCDAGDRRRLLAAGTLAALAILTRYVAVWLLPLGAAYALSRPAPRARCALALLPVALLVGGWCLQNWIEHGALHIVASIGHYSRYYDRAHLTGTQLLRIAASDVSALGGTAWVALALSLARGPARAGLWRLAVCLALAGGACLTRPFGLEELAYYTPGQTLGLALCLGCGLFLLVDAVRRSLGAGPDGWFLALWLVGTLFATILLLPFGAARYMLPVLAPLALILGLPAPARETPVGPRAALLVPALACALLLCAALGIADYQYAEVYRRFARDLPAPQGGRATWFVADWGLRYYMERAGGRYLLSGDGSPAAGDLIVRPQFAGLHDLSPDLRQRSDALPTLEASGGLPLRLLNAEARAGFYSHGWGLLPFAFSRAPLERFELYRVAAAGP